MQRLWRSGAETAGGADATCPHCGLVIDRDHNAAINILFRGEASGPRCYGGVEASAFGKGTSRSRRPSHCWKKFRASMPISKVTKSRSFFGPTGSSLIGKSCTHASDAGACEERLRSLQARDMSRLSQGSSMLLPSGSVASECGLADVNRHVRMLHQFGPLRVSVKRCSG